MQRRKRACKRTLSFTEEETQSRKSARPLKRQKSAQESVSHARTAEEDESFLNGIKIWLVKKGIGGVQYEILSNNIVRYGGILHSEFEPQHTDCIITRLTHPEFLRFFPQPTSSTPLHSLDWLTETLRQRRCLPATSCLLKPPAVADVTHSQPLLPAAGPTPPAALEFSFRWSPPPSIQKPQDVDSKESESADSPPKTTLEPTQEPFDLFTQTENWLTYDDTDSHQGIEEPSQVPAESNYDSDSLLLSSSFSDHEDPDEPLDPPLPAPASSSSSSSLSLHEPSPDSPPREISTELGLSQPLSPPPSSSTPPLNPRLLKRRSQWACQRSPSSGTLSENNNNNINHNKEITDILHILEQKSASTGDRWRSYAYRKAIAILSRHPFPITSSEQALSLRGIGKRITEKISEILQTGRLRKAEDKDEMTETMKIFEGVWGAGIETCRKWYGMGYRTREDLQNKAVPAGRLNKQQLIGLRYYDELKKRIPREEMKEMEGMVKKAAKEVDERLKVVICGSYRRGKMDCGDMDCLITLKRGEEEKGGGVLERMLEVLRDREKFLTDDLVVSRRVYGKKKEKEEEGKQQHLYMGVCKLNREGALHRRIDIRVVPREQWAFALLYFTGSDHFNRSMRLWARKHGMSLSEKALVVRFTEELVGEPMQGLHTERDVFKALGLEYKPPEDREV